MSDGMNLSWVRLVGSIETVGASALFRIERNIANTFRPDPLPSTAKPKLGSFPSPEIFSAPNISVTVYSHKYN